MMKQSMLTAGLPVLVIAVMVAWPALAETRTQTVAFEAECLDLDTGELMVDCRAHAGEESSEAVWDVVVGYHGDREVHAVVAPNPAAAVELAHLAGRAFDQVTAADVETAAFVRDVVDEAFEAGRVILVRTDLGAVFKLGRPVENDEGLTFDYALLVPAP